MTDKKYTIIEYNEIPFTVICYFEYDRILGDSIRYIVKEIEYREPPKTIWQYIRVCFAPTLCAGTYYRNQDRFTILGKGCNTFAETVKEKIAVTFNKMEQRNNFRREFDNIGDKLE